MKISSSPAIDRVKNEMKKAEREATRAEADAKPKTKIEILPQDDTTKLTLSTSNLKRATQVVNSVAQTQNIDDLSEAIRKRRKEDLARSHHEFDRKTIERLVL